MDEPEAPHSASAQEEARIGEMPAVFVNKVYVTRMPGGGAKITFAEARQSQDGDRASPRAAVFLQHADLAALRRLPDRAASPDEPSERFAGSMH